MSEYPVI